MSVRLDRAKSCLFFGTDVCGALVGWVERERSVSDLVDLANCALSTQISQFSTSRLSTRPPRIPAVSHGCPAVAFGERCLVPVNQRFGCVNRAGRRSRIRQNPGDKLPSCAALAAVLGYN